LVHCTSFQFPFNVKIPVLNHHALELIPVEVLANLRCKFHNKLANLIKAKTGATVAPPRMGPAGPGYAHCPVVFAFESMIVSSNPHV